MSDDEGELTAIKYECGNCGLRVRRSLTELDDEAEGVQYVKKDPEELPDTIPCDSCGLGKLEKTGEEVRE